MAKHSRYEKFALKTRKSRASTVLASERKTIATYTLDHQYVAALTLTDETTQKVLPLGTVLALNPVTNKVVPHYTSYGFGQVGVLLYDADCGEDTTGFEYDRVVDVVWAGEVYEKHCWDNGAYGSVLAATKAALSPRISFVKVSASGISGAKSFS